MPNGEYGPTTPTSTVGLREQLLRGAGAGGVGARTPYRAPVGAPYVAPPAPSPKWWEFWKAEPPPQSELAQIYAQQQAQPWWQQALAGTSAIQTQGGDYSQILGGVAPMLGGLGPSIGRAVSPLITQRLGEALTAVPRWMGAHKMATGALGAGGYFGLSNLLGDRGIATERGEFVPFSEAPLLTEEPVAAPGLPTPGLDDFGLGGEPQVVEVEGRQFWYDPGTGTWSLLSEVADVGAAQPSAAEIQAQTQLQIQQMQSQAAMEQMNRQYELQRQLQSAQEAQGMAQMYAADPYKYWAQMGQLTPEAVARLTGGEVEPGEPFKGVPLSYPSMQWWQNLLPSEQQQILGALNWMGISPEDWLTMLQRMIPGLGSRQMEPLWAR